MGYYLRSIQDEYDGHGNYIGNSEEGNRFHGVGRATESVRLGCSRCGSTSRRQHAMGGTVCAACDCAEATTVYRGP
jgi:hypothetical protein